MQNEESTYMLNSSITAFCFPHCEPDSQAGVNRRETGSKAGGCHRIHYPRPVWGRATQFPAALVKIQSIKQKLWAEWKLHRCIIYKGSQKLEHIANRADTPWGGGRQVEKKEKQVCLLTPIPKTARKKRTVSLARSTSNGISAAQTCSTTQDPHHQPPRGPGAPPSAYSFVHSAGTGASEVPEFVSPFPTFSQKPNLGSSSLFWG